MAGAPKRANKRKRRTVAVRSAPAQVDVSVHGLLEAKANRWKTPVAVAVGVIAIISGAVAFYKWSGLPIFVDTSTLHETIGRVRTEVNETIGRTKVEVIDHSNKNTTEVKNDVGVVKKQIDTIAKKQDQAAVRALQLQERQLFLQRANLMNSVSSVDLQLRERPNDQFLVQRKAELEAIRGNIDREADAVRDQIRRAQEGQ